MQLISTLMVDLKELGLMGELERTFCIPIEHTEVNNCVDYCFTFKNIFQRVCFAMLHSTSDWQKGGDRPKAMWLAEFGKISGNPETLSQHKLKEYCSFPSVLKTQKYSWGLPCCLYVISPSASTALHIHCVMATPQKSVFKKCVAFSQRALEDRCAHWQCRCSCILNITETWLYFFTTNLSFCTDSPKQKSLLV